MLVTTRGQLLDTGYHSYGLMKDISLALYMHALYIHHRHTLASSIQYVVCKYYLQTYTSGDRFMDVVMRTVLRNQNCYEGFRENDTGIFK